MQTQINKQTNIERKNLMLSQFSDSNRNNAVVPAEPIKGQFLKEASEFFLQKAIVEHFKKTYPEYANLFFFVNNSAPDRLLGSQAVALGTTKGVFDLQGLIRNASYNGFSAEIKCGVNELSAEQETFREQVSKQGFKTFVWYSLNQAKEDIADYMAHTVKKIGRPAKAKKEITNHAI